jgi:catechol 2,3-dioxygenase
MRSIQENQSLFEESERVLSGLDTRSYDTLRSVPICEAAKLPDRKDTNMVAPRDIATPSAKAQPEGRGPIVPIGVNHIVLNVRNIEESHQFWTEVVGLRLVGKFRQLPGRKMWFYSGIGPNGLNHHDLALVENPNLPPPPAEWAMWDMPMAINHIAIAYPSREDWLSQLAYLQQKGVKFDRRIDHGMTHSLYLHDPNGYGVELVYELPREVWEGDIDAALNFAELRPHDGPEALIDRTDVPTFGEQSRVQQ